MPRYASIMATGRTVDSGSGAWRSMGAAAVAAVLPRLAAATEPPGPPAAGTAAMTRPCRRRAGRTRPGAARLVGCGMAAQGLSRWDAVVGKRMS